CNAGGARICDAVVKIIITGCNVVRFATVDTKLGVDENVSGQPAIDSSLEVMFLGIGRPAPLRVQIVTVCKQAERSLCFVVVGGVCIVHEQIQAAGQLSSVAQGHTFECGQT